MSASNFASRDLYRLLSDIDWQPAWRSESSRCADYYDGKQLSQEQIEALNERGQPVMVHNLVAPAVDGVLGMEAKTRQGVMVRADDQDGTEVAEALNEKVNEISRLAEVDRHCSDAFAGQTKAGLGWVEVNRSRPGSDFPYQASYVHRDEIWWDWHSKRSDLKDARWLLRKRWLDRDEAVAFFPRYESLINYSSKGWADFAFEIENQTRPALVSAYQEYGAYNWNDADLFDSERGRIRVYEVWYRCFVKGYMIKLHTDGREIVYDQANPVHGALITQGYAKLVSRPMPKMHRAWFIGAHLIDDSPSPLPHNDFPYTPFFAYREDSSGVPYGIVRRMLSPQDEYNFRRSKLTYLLNYKRIIMDDDATEMSDQDLIDEVNRADGLIKLNPARRNRDGKGFWVETETGIVAQQFSIMQDSKQMIQDAAGIFSAMLGQESNATSGVAIHGLIEQGNTTLAELFDNYRYARKKVYEQVLAFAVADIAEQTVDVTANVHSAERTKTIRLNEPVLEDGIEKIRNNVKRARLHVVLDDITNTPGYRAQLTERMMTLLQSLPDQMQMVLLDLVLELTDMPRKDEVLKRVRKVTGQGIDPAQMTDEERQQIEEAQQKQSMMEQLQLREIAAKLDGLEADSMRKKAAAEKDLAAAAGQEAKNENTEAQTLKILAELKQITRALDGAMFNQTARIAQPMLEPVVSRF